MLFFSKSSAFTKSVLSLLSLTAASVAPRTLADSPQILDLSQEFPQGMVDNTAAANFKSYLTRDVRRFLILDDGVVKMDYQRDGVGDDDVYNVWSSTKSFISVITLTVMDSEEYDLSMDDTLGDIFPDENDWSDITDPDEVAFKQNVTMFELLTMTSGLTSFVDGNLFIPNPFKPFDVPNSAGINLKQSLAYPSYNESLKGQEEIFYTPTSNILSYVILAVTGMTPREYAAVDLFPSLGIDNDKIEWDQNFGGVEASYSNLKLTARNMAKFGQLFLQKGKSAPDKQLLSEEFVEMSLTPYATKTQNYPGGQMVFLYGLLWNYIPFVSDIFEAANSTSIGEGMWCAAGTMGQVMCFNYESKRVVAFQRSNTVYNMANEAIAYGVCQSAFRSDISWDYPVAVEEVESGAFSRTVSGVLAMATVSCLAFWL